MIDDGPLDNSAQNMNSGPVYGLTSKQNYDEQHPRIDYSMPGILHYLQTEWAKFEMERAQWDVERAELQARIAFLQGERKGQENLKKDLVRRIKMLEFALRQERAKYQKLQYGAEHTNPSTNQVTANSEDEYEENVQMSAPTEPTYRQGRQLLKQYLEEIGFTDVLLDVRSSRVRSLLGLHTDRDVAAATAPPKDVTTSVNQITADSRVIKTAPPIKAEPGLLSNDDSYLPQQSGTVIDDADDSDEDDSQEDNDDDDDLEERRRIAASLPSGKSSGAHADEDDDNLEEAQALAEFDFLVSETGNSEDSRTAGDGSEWVKDTDWPMDQTQLNRQIEQYKTDMKNKHDHSQRPKKDHLKAMIATLGSGDETQAENSDKAFNGSPGRADVNKTSEILRLPPGASLDRHFEAAGFGLGDLAELSVNNDETDSSSAYDITTAESGTRKNWDAKYTLRSHFDGVRALVFHPVEPVLLTASEDHTMKLWNLQKTVPTKKPTALDVEPVYTFRAHQGPVLCVAMSATGEECFSGGLDSTIRCWNLPSSSIDPYDSYDSSILQDTLVAHTDAVWGLAIHSTKMQLLSCSADGSIKLWSPGLKMQPCHSYFPPAETDGIPTCIDFLPSEPNHMMAAYTSGNAYVFDLATGKQVVKLQSLSTDGSQRINRLVSHPTLPIAISAHENRCIRFYDSSSGQVTHSMIAHLDAVTSLAVDPNGLYLLSGSHDCSIRLWSMENKTCIQEITCHRKKYDESIYDVAFHPSKPYIASAGADGVAKVLV